MLKQCLLAPALAGVFVLSSAGFAATVTEDFSSDPQTRGWNATGHPGLFSWNPVHQHLDVTWDSRQPNSYYVHSLGTVLTRNDDFSLAFDLRLADFTPGIDPQKANGPFGLSVGLIHLERATNANFMRGSGMDSPDLVDFSFFPDPGGDWLWGPSLTSVMVDSTGFNWSSGGFAPLGLSTNDVYRITLAYTAGNATLVTTITRNGEPFGPVSNAVLGTNFLDFRVDHIAVCSYNDAGQYPGFEGSLLAHGAVDNFAMTLPSPVENITGAFVGNIWQTRFNSRSNWLYTLERNVDWLGWTNVSSAAAGTGGPLVLSDTNAPSGLAFYRVRADKP